MNSFDNVDLTYYGEDLYIINNVKYHDMQEKIKGYLQHIINTIAINRLAEKSYYARDFANDLRDVVSNISTVRNYDGRTNRISITDKYIHFDYPKKDGNTIFFEEVIIDKSANEFYFIKTGEDMYFTVTEYSFQRSGISKDEYSDVPPLFLYDDESIDQSLDQLKNNVYGSKMAM